MKKIFSKPFFLLFFMFFCLNVFSQEIKWLSLYDFKGEAGIGFESLKERVNNDGETLYDYNEDYFKYTLGLKFAGYMYHPYFFEFFVSTDMILNKVDTSLFADTQAYSDTNNRYNIDIFLLKRKPLNFRLYFQNNETTRPRVYLGRYFNYFQRNGIIVKSNYRFLPFTLDISHSSTISQSIMVYDRRESTNDIKLKSEIFKTDYGLLIFQGAYKNYNESVLGSDYVSINSMISWNTDFGEKEKGRVSAVINYSRINGVSFVETVSGKLFYMKPLISDLDFTSSFSLRHLANDNLSKNISLLNVGLMHRLYLSVVSKANFFYQKEKGDFETITRGTIFFNVNYSKKIPSGRISLNFEQYYQNVNNISGGQYSLNHLYASFDLSDTITINQSGIDPNSIAVYSKDGSELYVEGVDYNLVVSGTSVVIVRLFGGKIEEGETVLIVYNVTQYPDFNMFIHNYQDSGSITFLKYLFIGGKIAKSRNTVDSNFIITPYEEFTMRESYLGVKTSILYYQRTKTDYNGSYAEYKLKSENFRISFKVNRFKIGYYFLKYNLNFLSSDYFNHFRTDAIYLSGSLLRKVNYQIDYRKLRYNQNNFLRVRESIICRINGAIRKLRLEFFYEHILDTGVLSDRKHDYFRVSLRRIF